MVNELGIGAILIAAVVVMIGLILTYAHMDNKVLREKEEWRKAQKWNWD